MRYNDEYGVIIINNYILCTYTAVHILLQAFV